jgi:IS30 family transposase
MHRPKICELLENRSLARIVSNKLRLAWSPEKIVGWLKWKHPGAGNNQVPHETVYRSLSVRARGALKKELLQYPRRTRSMRRSSHHTQNRDGHGRITDTVSMGEPSALVEDRAVPGYWEGDLVSGSNNGHIATLVERHTRYVVPAKVNGKDTETVINALIKRAHKLPKVLLTWDCGKETADHQRFTLATDFKVCFCSPQSP